MVICVFVVHFNIRRRYMGIAKYDIAYFGRNPILFVVKESYPDKGIYSFPNFGSIHTPSSYRSLLKLQYVKVIRCISQPFSRPRVLKNYTHVKWAAMREFFNSRYDQGVAFWVYNQTVRARFLLVTFFVIFFSIKFLKYNEFVKFLKIKLIFNQKGWLFYDEICVSNQPGQTFKPTVEFLTNKDDLNKSVEISTK